MWSAEIEDSAQSMSQCDAHSAFIIHNSALKKILSLRQNVNNMSVLMLIFGLVAGCLLAVIVGLVGSRRRIGFGWAFLLSVCLSPLVGLIVTLCTPKLPNRDRKWGCIGGMIGFFVIAVLVVLLIFLMPELYEMVRTWIESLK